MIRSQLSCIDDLCVSSIGLSPGNKRKVSVENLKSHGGYIPWLAYKQNRPEDVIYAHSNILLDYTDATEELFKNGCVLTKQERVERELFLHNKGQEKMQDIYRTTLNMIKEHSSHGITQAELSKLLVGPKYGDKNFTTYTIGHMLKEAGAIDIERESRNRTRYGYLKDTLPPMLLYNVSHRGVHASKNEARFAQLLEEYDIPFQSQCVFKDCVHKKPLPFDFCLDLGVQQCLVEIQGEQHYRFVSAFHKSEADFLLQLKKDKIKQEYALDHGFMFVTIKYDEDFKSRLLDIMMA